VLKGETLTPETPRATSVRYSMAHAEGVEVRGSSSGSQHTVQSIDILARGENCARPKILIEAADGTDRGTPVDGLYR
jgi:hypothetical protein